MIPPPARRPGSRKTPAGSHRPGTPRQASLRRLREFGIRPNRELGQNFLADDNILRVIEREAELGADDVVLEIGGGLGVLSEHLAPRVAYLHVVEVDGALAPALEQALAPFGDRVELHIADALELDLVALSPAPTKVVANLPYGVAATVILKTVFELSGVGMWLVMTQREVGERLAAAPGSKTYAASSVLAQLGCEVELVRRVPATVFHPAPAVESALVRLRRRGRAPAPEVRELVRVAFAHRRKTLAGSLALDPAAPEGIRERARRGLEQLGHPPDARPERLAPQDFAALAELLAEPG